MWETKSCRGVFLGVNEHAGLLSMSDHTVIRHLLDPKTSNLQ